MVDGGLAAHRGVHEGQQRGRDLHQAHAAVIGGGGEPGHVAGHAAAQGDNGGGPVVSILDQGVENRGVGIEGLERFAVADLDHINLVDAQEAAPGLVEIQRCRPRHW